ncbi:YchJ family protein [Pseudocolwellia agarivorans]|jgi:SEC-C motif-containing protein|uniref:YchJ family protein n=1 Tax=Pseudocolwellia agarivorans TaxID=1911682 RepID=UPI003F880509
MLCPCGTNIEYNKCCETIISNAKKARSPEQLMRSRYTAYAIKNSQYIFNTYSSASQKKQSLQEIDTWAKDTQWLNLYVVGTSEHINNATPTVTFEAIYKNNGSFYKMREKSSFVKENDHWRYVDGSDLTFDELNTPKRNDVCFCSSGKKYKKCCGK